jgi:hypothetical protein
MACAMGRADGGVPRSRRAVDIGPDLTRPLELAGVSARPRTPVRVQDATRSATVDHA